MIHGTHSGIVEAVNDPEEIGRLKVRVPTIYGPGDTIDNSIATSDLPWALPAGLPAGGTKKSGAVMWLPDIGDPVFVRFLDGSPEKPIWEWGCQNRSQKKVFPYWKRNPGGYINGSPPDAAALIKHGHMIEIGPLGIMAVTQSGYALILTDTSDNGFGLAQLLTAKGYQISIDDNTDEMTIYVPNLHALIEVSIFVGTKCLFSMSELFKVSAANAEIVAGQAKITTTEAVDIKAGTKATVVAPHVALGEADASDSIVRLSDLKSAISSVVTQFNTHIHPSVGAPPTKPMSVTPTGSEIAFSA